eukprot:m.42959 g.42959  ORF g.42959 m.42959 type:complete len:458 (+) comp8379_c0_seq1:186-1559(+)
MVTVSCEGTALHCAIGALLGAEAAETYVSPIIVAVIAAYLLYLQIQQFSEDSSPSALDLEIEALKASTNNDQDKCHKEVTKSESAGTDASTNLDPTEKGVYTSVTSQDVGVEKTALPSSEPKDISTVVPAPTEIQTKESPNAPAVSKVNGDGKVDSAMDTSGTCPDTVETAVSTTDAAEANTGNTSPLWSGSDSETSPSHDAGAPMAKVRDSLSDEGQSFLKDEVPANREPARPSIAMTTVGFTNWDSPLPDLPTPDLTETPLPKTPEPQSITMTTVGEFVDGAERPSDQPTIEATPLPLVPDGALTPAVKEPSEQIVTGSGDLVGANDIAEKAAVSTIDAAPDDEPMSLTEKYNRAKIVRALCDSQEESDAANPTALNAADIWKKRSLSDASSGSTPETVVEAWAADNVEDAEVATVSAIDLWALPENDEAPVSETPPPVPPASFLDADSSEDEFA